MHIFKIERNMKMEGNRHFSSLGDHQTMSAKNKRTVFVLS